MSVPNGNNFIVSVGARVSATLLASAIIASLFTIASEASPIIKIEGGQDALSLITDDASVAELLSALSGKFNLMYASSVELDRTVAGTYSGNLQNVLRRLLEGYDYVAVDSADSIELKVWARSGAAAHPSGLPPPPNLTAAAASQIPTAPPAFNSRQPPPEGGPAMVDSAATSR